MKEPKKECICPIPQTSGSFVCISCGLPCHSKPKEEQVEKAMEYVGERFGRAIGKLGVTKPKEEVAIGKVDYAQHFPNNSVHPFCSKDTDWNAMSDKMAKLGEIQEMTKTDYGEGYDNGYAKGREEGYKEGYEEGREERLIEDLELNSPEWKKIVESYRQDGRNEVIKEIEKWSIEKLKAAQRFKISEVPMNSLLDFLQSLKKNK